ncbi:hypothetical protein [Thiohalospira sp.]|uniref:hypothetical protein n=1 Tax=Thiohalospira sp. TaxID=3080549 RepID=UPI00397F9081
MSDLAYLVLAWIHDHPISALLAGVVVGLGLLYLARPAVHHFLLSTARQLRGLLRHLAVGVQAARRGLAERNRRVRRAIAVDRTEERLARSLSGMEALVEREFGQFPELQRRLNDAIAEQEREYQASSTPPPLPAAWGEATEAVAAISDRSDGTTADMLARIRQSLEQSEVRALRRHRREFRRRQQRLRALLPLWRRVQASLDALRGRIRALEERGRHIDGLWQSYQQLLAAGDGVDRQLNLSALVRFFLNGFAMAVLALIAAAHMAVATFPLQEVVGAGNQLGPWSAASVAAAALVGMAFLGGALILESTRLTRLLPQLDALEGHGRQALLAVGVVLVVATALLGAVLGYLHQAVEVEVASLAAEADGLEPGRPGTAATVTHVLLGLIFPLALAVALLPLEGFVKAARVVIGLAVEGLLAALALALRWLGTALVVLARLLARLYDVVIFLPLWLRERLTRRRASARSEGSTAA